MTKTNLIETYSLREALAKVEVGADKDAQSYLGTQKFSETRDFEEAMNFARHGWKDGSARLRAKMGSTARIRDMRRPRPQWGPQGSSVDIGRYMVGEPDNMVEMTRQVKPSPILKIVVVRSVSWNISASVIESVGASVLTVVDNLRGAGISTEIWVAFSVESYGGGHISTQICVQEPGRPLDLDVLAFWVAHPSALRRLAFGLWETKDQEIRVEFGFRSGGGYGTPAGQHLNGTFYADFDEIAPASKDAAQQWMTEVLLRRTGIRVEA